MALLKIIERPANMTIELPKDHSIARERILDAAYELFSAHGVEAVGVDAIVARSGTGKMTLYRHFKSKEALVLAFLKRRREIWTGNWLLARVNENSGSPSDSLLAFFGVYQEWFLEPDFEGCPFVNTLVEARNSDNVRHAAAEYLAEIRSAIETRARSAGLMDVERLARAWNTLLMGAIISRLSGQLDAAREAQATARLLLASWPRIPSRD
jgi:AcrR family transcriptional regulator